MSKTPCNDCPWRRASAKGWLGGEMDAAAWASVAHSDDTVECHVREGDHPCMGLAIYRRNVCKQTRPPNPEAEPDKEHVFASPMEFHQHHTGEDLPADWQLRRLQHD